jgi:hypothetical protein
MDSFATLMGIFGSQFFIHTSFIMNTMTMVKISDPQSLGKLLWSISGKSIKSLIKETRKYE